MNPRILCIVTFCFTSLFFECSFGPGGDPDLTPYATTYAVTDVGTLSATFHGAVYTPEFEYSILSNGFCWGVNPDPSLKDNSIVVPDGSRSISIDVPVTSLGARTTYFVRCYATYEGGTVYGKGVFFETTAFGPITYNGTVYVQGSAIFDSEGNQYHFQQIGTQVWMSDNLKSTKYSDGSAIPKITDTTAWRNLTTGAYDDYNNAPNNTPTLGLLYNWEAVNNPANICPAGWHVPTDDEWKTLEVSQGMASSYYGTDATGWRGTDQGGKLKEVGSSHWTSNLYATNASNFTAIPGGYRDSNGEFEEGGSSANYWTASQNDASSAWSRTLGSSQNKVNRSAVNMKRGYCVRCVKD